MGLMKLDANVTRMTKKIKSDEEKAGAFSELILFKMDGLKRTFEDIKILHDLARVEMHELKSKLERIDHEIVLMVVDMLHKQEKLDSETAVIERKVELLRYAYVFELSDETKAEGAFTEHILSELDSILRALENHKASVASLLTKLRESSSRF